MGIAADSHGDLTVYGAGNNGKVSYQSCPSAGGCSFLVKLNPTGSALLSSSIFSLLPNQGTRGGNLLGMDAQKNVYLAGISGYPVSGNGVFVAKLNSTGTALVYGTYIGAPNEDALVGGIAIDAAGEATVCGRTDSMQFPVTPGALQRKSAGVIAAYSIKVAKPHRIFS